MGQIQTAQQIIRPVFEARHPDPPPLAGEGMGGGASGAVYDYEPDEEEILAQILPRNIAVQIFRALLENNSSFYGAQMSAMDNATRNARATIRKQTVRYNRHRQ